MVAEQIHTAKAGKEWKRQFGNCVVSVLKRVKILEIRESYNCKQLFGVSFQGTALAIHAGSQPTCHPSKEWSQECALDCGFSFRLATPLYGLCLAYLNGYTEYFIDLILIQEYFLQDGWKENASAGEGSAHSHYEEHCQGRGGESESPWHDFEPEM